MSPARRKPQAPITVATFNVNNVVKRLPNLIAWLEERSPDIVCLQELKTTDDAFPAQPLERAADLA